MTRQERQRVAARVRWGIGVVLLVMIAGIGAKFYAESVSRRRAIDVLAEQGWLILPESGSGEGWGADMRRRWAAWFPRVGLLMEGLALCDSQGDNQKVPRKRLNDATRNALSHVAGLRGLYFGRLVVEDDDMVLVERHSDLDTLFIHDSPITDRAAEHIAKLKRLETLMVDGSRMSIEGLRQLKGLKRLNALSVKGIAADDEAVRGLLGQWPALQKVMLPSGTMVDLTPKSNPEGSTPGGAGG